MRQILKQIFGTNSRKKLFWEMNTKNCKFFQFLFCGIKFMVIWTMFLLLNYLVINRLLIGYLIWVFRQKYIQNELKKRKAEYDFVESPESSSVSYSFSSSLLFFSIPPVLYNVYWSIMFFDWEGYLRLWYIQKINKFSST